MGTVLNNSGVVGASLMPVCELVGVSVLNGELNSPSNNERNAVTDKSLLPPPPTTWGLMNLGGGVLNTIAFVDDEAEGDGGQSLLSLKVAE